jgi:hypothetical protein
VLCCGCAASPPAPVYVSEVPQYQGFYGVDGRVRRLHFKPDSRDTVLAVTLFRADGTLLAAEIDIDHDGVIDRREWYGVDGALERVAGSPAGNTPPRAP